MKVVIKEFIDSESTKEEGVVFFAVSNFTTSVSFGGHIASEENANNKDKFNAKSKNKEEGGDSNVLSGSVNFEVYLDSTGMLYPPEKQSIEEKLVLLHETLINENKKSKSVQLLLGEKVDEETKYTLKSMNTAYEMMTENGQILRAKISLSFNVKIEKGTVFSIAGSFSDMKKVSEEDIGNMLEQNETLMA